VIGANARYASSLNFPPAAAIDARMRFCYGELRTAESTCETRHAS